MTRLARSLALLSVALTACNVQISSPGTIGDGTGSGTTRLPAPEGLLSVSLDGAVQLSWSNKVVTAHASTFKHYRVYSSSYDATTSRCNESAWTIEGTTVSDGFLAGNLRNGVSRCFAVTSVARDDGEGARGSARVDTPRHGGRFVLVDAYESRPTTAGWLFYEASSGRVAVVSDGARSDLDFRVERHADGSLWFRPIRTANRVAVFGNTPIPDLTVLDRAPASGYSFANVEALAGFAYVFSVQQPDGVHFGAVRVAYVGRDYVVLDWAYQSAVNNTELYRM